MMRMYRTPAALLFAMTAAILMSACGPETYEYRVPGNDGFVTVQEEAAPLTAEHGYRHKHPDGVTLEFDGEFGVYQVIGFYHTYFYKDTFYRLFDGKWEKCDTIGGPWKPTKQKDIPPGLRSIPME